MEMILFLFNSLLLGIGLAMDAFTVAMANAIARPKMPSKEKHIIAGAFSFFQGLMPLIGWFVVKSLAEAFEIFDKYDHWIAFIVLAIIGLKMFFEKSDDNEASASSFSLSLLLVQAIATSIDALSVGFTIKEYSFGLALVAAIIIAVVTYIISYFGIYLGIHFGNRYASKAGKLGGVILILIGIELLVKGILGI